MTHICPCEGGVGGEVWYLGVVVEQVDEDGPAEQRGAQAVQQPAAQGEHDLLDNSGAEVLSYLIIIILNNNLATYEQRWPDSVVGGGGEAVAEQQHERGDQARRVGRPQDAQTPAQLVRVSCIKYRCKARRLDKDVKREYQAGQLCSDDGYSLWAVLRQDILNDETKNQLSKFHDPDWSLHKI